MPLITLSLYINFVAICINSSNFVAPKLALIVLRRVVIIVLALICGWIGTNNSSYAGVVSIAKDRTDYYIGENYNSVSDVSTFGQLLFDDDIRVPYSKYADDGVELRFFEIRNIDFRLFLLYHLTQDERFELDIENENGVFIINSGNDMLGDDFYDAFEEFYIGTYADFQLLSKVDIAELFPIWKTNVSPRYLMSVLMDITISKSRSDNDHCINANPFCTSDYYEFESAYSDGEADEDADFGCIGAPRNPSWYFMRIGYSGPFVIHMEGHDPNDPNSLLDIDFCLWGPFTQQEVETGSACSLLTTDKIIDCSYSLAGVEDAYLGYHVSQHTSHYEDQLADGNITFHIPQSGEYYLLMITNFSNQACTINFNYASGTGTTDCTILPPMLENDGPYCVGDDIQLTANTTHYASYHWTGPNGFSSNLQNPTITNCTMANAGTYYCSIQVGSQQSSTATTQVIVYPRPIANFTITSVCQGSATQFTSTSTTNPTGSGGVYDITSYQWNFGDGQMGYGQSTSHTYAAPGTYYATLTVSTGNGRCTDQITHTVTVKPQPTAGFIATTVCQGAATQFTNTSTTNPSGQTMTYLWDFGEPTSGNSNTSTLQNPTHTYAQGGTYPVTLIVQTNGGCADTITNAVVVIPQVGVHIDVEGDTEICLGDTVVLHAVIDSVDIHYYAPGDILCTDGTIVRPDDWPVAGKVAKGIVFYVDNTGSHGWAVSLTSSNSLKWCTLSTPTLIGAAYDHWRDAIGDMNGAARTQSIKNAGTSSDYPAAWNPNASQGWYLPAIGQLNVLFGELVAVNYGLSKVIGAQQITDTAGDSALYGNVFLWSSTEKSSSSAYALEVQDGQIGGLSKSVATSGKQFIVRAIIDF
jgi:PKD repeat protein